MRKVQFGTMPRFLQGAHQACVNQFTKEHIFPTEGYCSIFLMLSTKLSVV